jgi:hypothetical protein
MNDTLIILLPSIVTGIGFLARYFYERHIAFQNEIKNKKLDALNTKLTNFYYPLYFNLERLTNLWNISRDVCIDDEIIKIHINNQDIIKNNIVSAKPIPKLLHEIMKYDKHVTILKMLRSAECKKTREYDAQYPEEFKEIVQQRINALENDALLV